MTRTDQSAFSTTGTFLFLILALSSLAFFVQQRDPGGFLAWVFGFAALLSVPGRSVPENEVGA